MTSTANRPSLARKVTPKSEANREAALNEGVRLTIDGEDFVLRMGDVTPDIAREVRRVTGRSFSRLLSDLSTDPDIDVVAEAVWVARRCRGEKVTLDDVAMTYDLLLSDNFDIDTAGPVGPDEVDDSPEA